MLPTLPTRVCTCTRSGPGPFHWVHSGEPPPLPEPGEGPEGGPCAPSYTPVPISHAQSSLLHKCFYVGSGAPLRKPPLLILATAVLNLGRKEALGLLPCTGAWRGAGAEQSSHLCRWRWRWPPAARGTGAWPDFSFNTQNPVTGLMGSGRRRCREACLLSAPWLLTHAPPLPSPHPQCTRWQLQGCGYRPVGG